MARAIDADNVLERIENIAQHWQKQGKKYEAMLVPSVMKSIIDSEPTLTPPNEWVSVEEKLPTDERPVLVFVGYADTMTGFITTSSYFCFDVNPHWQWDGLVRDEQRTLFWMPLPAPPGKDNNVPTNEPLTLDELREVKDEPAYLKVFDPLLESGWHIIKAVTEDKIIFRGWQTVYVPIDGMGIDYNLYRRPPEGEEDT